MINTQKILGLPSPKHYRFEEKLKDLIYKLFISSILEPSAWLTKHNRT